MAETEGLDDKEPLTHSSDCKSRELRAFPGRITVQNRIISPSLDALPVPRKPDPEMAYLTVHDGLYRVSMGVPKELRSQLGSRLVKSTGTKSKGQAKIARDRIVPEFKKRIEDAWKARGGKRGSLLAEALETRKLLETASDDLADFMIKGALERSDEILDEGATWVDEPTPDGVFPVRRPTPEAVKAVTEFRRVLAGDTPIAFHHQAFVDGLKIKPARSWTNPGPSRSSSIGWRRTTSSRSSRTSTSGTQSDSSTGSTLAATCRGRARPSISAGSSSTGAGSPGASTPRRTRSPTSTSKSPRRSAPTTSGLTPTRKSRSCSWAARWRDAGCSTS